MHGTRIRFLVSIAAVMLLLSACGSSSSSYSTPTPPPKTATITPSVTYSNLSFTITNKDTFDWTDVRLEINGQFFKGGYCYTVARLGAGKKVTIPARDFALSDGTRYNASTTKLLSFNINTDTPNGRAWWTGE